MSWTTDRVELLTKLWAEGLSASQIAAELGNVTRNAVIGKVHRLGLSGRVKSTNSSKPRRNTSSSTSPSPRKTAPPASAKSDSAPVKARSASPLSQQTHQPSVSGANALKIEPEIIPVGEIEPVSSPDSLMPMSERATILSLNERTCKWPIGDPGGEDFHFCGRQSDGSTPYCAHHRRVAYQPVSERRRERKATA
ncbi:GcrA family cell cycle regulator [Flexibacterium corallicola]|uniref:GcrA family cell cycle regulator n=1 Tax=Flexibacterium corallicola TaxID=3037259 RepID=UPI00286ECDA1|nr:GcrA family cell cycle regulator [Pseudovibrio sp. M1P-2-3]